MTGAIYWEINLSTEYGLDYWSQGSQKLKKLVGTPSRVRKPVNKMKRKF